MGFAENYSIFQKAFKESCDSVGVPCLFPEGISIGNGMSVYAFVGAVCAGLGDIVKNMPRNATVTDLLVAAITRGNATVTSVLYKIPNLSEWANAKMWTRGRMLPPGFGASASLARTAGNAYAAWTVGAWIGASIYAFNVWTGANDVILAPMTGIANDYYEAGGFWNWMAGAHDINRKDSEASARLAAMRRLKKIASESKVQIPSETVSKTRR